MTDRSRGALLGLAVGDALGTTLEFERPGTFAPGTGLVGGGRFNLQPGERTDDINLALCLMGSLSQGSSGLEILDRCARNIQWAAA
jgi:ADP-ribosylglycohydrolase